MKLRLRHILAAVFFCFAAVNGEAAVNATAGISVFYAQWESAWREIPGYKMTPFWTNKQVKRDSDIDPFLLYGPVLSVSLTDRLSIASSFLWGSNYNVKLNSVYDAYDETDVYRFRAYSEEKIDNMSRFDLDTTINYVVTSWFKVFAGIKYQGFDYDFDVDGTVPSFLFNYFVSAHVKSRGLGGGAGAGISLPVYDLFFIQFNESILVLDATWKYSDYSAQNCDPTVPVEKKFTCLGSNTSLNAAYYIESTSTVVSIGFRFQYIRYLPRDADDDALNDYIYGLTAGAIYSFSI